MPTCLRLPPMEVRPKKQHTKDLRNNVKNMVLIQTSAKPYTFSEGHELRLLDLSNFKSETVGSKMSFGRGSMPTTPRSRQWKSTVGYNCTSVMRTM